MARLHYMALPDVSNWSNLLDQVTRQLKPFVHYFHTAKNTAAARSPTALWQLATPRHVRELQQRQSDNYQAALRGTASAKRRRDRHAPTAPATHGTWIVIDPYDDSISDAAFEGFFDPEARLFAHPAYHRERQLKVLAWDMDDRALLVAELPFNDAPADAPNAVPIPRIWLKPNTTVLDRQLSAACELRDAPKRRHAPLIKLLANPATWPDILPSDSTVEWQYLISKDGQPTRDGTDQQRDFVVRALETPDFAVLEGPPGSGKSTAICELVTQLALRGKRVLLVASTHVAVDNVLERIIAHQDASESKLVLPVRIGDEGKITSRVVTPWRLQTLERTTHDELRDFFDRARHSTVLDRRAGHARDHLESAIGKEQSLVTRMILEASNLVCGTTIGILKHPELQRARTEDASAFRPFDVMILDEASKTTFGEFLVPALLAERWIIVGDTKQLSPFVDAEELAGNLDGLLTPEVATAAIHGWLAAQSPGKKRTSLIATNGDASALRDEARARGIDFVDLDATSARPFGDTHAIPELLYADIVAGRPDTLRRFEHRLPPTLEILGGTFPELPDFQATWRAHHQANAHHDDHPSWSDEVAWRLIRSHELRNNPLERTHLIRDLQALQPMGRPPQLRSKLDMDLEAIRRVSLPSVLELLQHGFGDAHSQSTALTHGLPKYALQQRMVSLSFQHRMHPDISAFPRSRFYAEEGSSHLLQDSATMRDDRAWSYSQYATRAHWLDVTPRSSTNRDNPAEVSALMSELESFINWAQRNPRRDRPWQVAMLTFYRGQEELMRVALQRSTNQSNHFHWDDARTREPVVTLELCTVDGFQGHEADLVLLSFVRSGGTVGFLNSPNRLNVALTRARYQLVMCGDRRFFASAKSRSPLLNELATTPLYRHDLTWKESK